MPSNKRTPHRARDRPGGFHFPHPPGGLYALTGNIFT